MTYNITYKFNKWNIDFIEEKLVEFHENIDSLLKVDALREYIMGDSPIKIYPIILDIKRLN